MTAERCHRINHASRRRTTAGTSLRIERNAHLGCRQNFVRKPLFLKQAGLCFTLMNNSSDALTKCIRVDGLEDVVSDAMLKRCNGAVYVSVSALWKWKRRQSTKRWHSVRRWLAQQDDSRRTPALKSLPHNVAKTRCRYGQRFILLHLFSFETGRCGRSGRWSLPGLLYSASA